MVKGAAPEVLTGKCKVLSEIGSGKDEVKKRRPGNAKAWRARVKPPSLYFSVT